MFVVLGHETTSLVSKPLPVVSDPLKAFIMCFIPVFFTYGGYQHTINFGSDIANPSRTLPKSIFIGITVILVLYLAVNFSYFSVLGFDKLASTKTLAADMVYVLFGRAASIFISIIMFFAVMAYVNVSILSNPRVYYAMAEERVLPSFFMYINSKTQVQIFGVIVFCVFIILTLITTYILSDNVEKSLDYILNYVIFFDSISLCTGAAALFILRYRGKKDNSEDSKFVKTPFYPILPIIFILVYFTMSIGNFLTNPDLGLLPFLVGLSLVLSGYPLFYLIRRAINN
jgi:APA family basic amino acid/polyamine antiporter